MGTSAIQTLAAFRFRHDAGAFYLPGACSQDSSQVRYRQGWAFVHYFYADQTLSHVCMSTRHSVMSVTTSIHGRCSDALRSPAVLGILMILTRVKRDVKAQVIVQGGTF